MPLSLNSTVAGSQRIFRTLLLVLIAGLSLAQNSDVVTPDMRRVGDRLACLCGSCKNTVATCPMLGCHYSAPGRERIAKLQAQGLADDAVVDDFVKREGRRALAMPPAEGFQLLGWAMPFISIAIGLWVIYLFIRKYRKPASAATPIDRVTLDKYQAEIDKDLAKLE
jgi:cytochrome c-type biogenesis protein CcmH/NrfF